LTFNEYQEWAKATADYPGDRGDGKAAFVPGLYPALGLNGEAGEVAEKIKKFWRDGNAYDETRAAIRKELGDVLWYLSETARQWGIKLDDVAAGNIAKLADRKSRGVLAGSGDNR